MKTPLILALLLLPASAFAQTMRFRYVPNEGDFGLDCTHERIQDLPDWRVSCGPNAEKKFSVHLIVRTFPGAGTKSTLEIMYWVTESSVGTKPPVFHANTSWLRFKSGGELESLSMHQGVENDYASLTIELKTTGATAL
ncbi:MAG: hypothetical protein HY059_09385 [Proteobacteria bacterium]|nr:hypothetical protein [Pseudomonadota bacterium]